MDDDSFQEDKSEMEESVETALEEIAGIKVYVMRPKELIVLKIIQYGLWYISEDHDRAPNLKKLKEAVKRL